MFHNTFILLIVLIYWRQKIDTNDGFFPGTTNTLPEAVYDVAFDEFSPSC
jgi:hypothetical protein